MSLEQFKVGLADLYQREVSGEVALIVLLEKFRSPRQQYLLGTVLQLETETKARLRPAAFELGISLAEQEEYRAAGAGLAKAVEGMDWDSAVKELAAAMATYVKEYREIAATAPPEYRALADSMVAHEESIERLFVLEAAGAPEHSTDDIVRQLVHPLPKP